MNWRKIPGAEPPRPKRPLHGLSQECWRSKQPENISWSLDQELLGFIDVINIFHGYHHRQFELNLQRLHPKLSIHLFSSSNFNKIVMFNASPNIKDVKISFKCGPTIVTKMYKINLVFDGNGNKTGTIMNYVLCGLLFLILSFVLIKKYGFPKYLSMLFNFLQRIFIR